MPLESLESAWSLGSRPAARGEGRAPRPASARLRPAAATLLDRAAWLLARHADLWLTLPDADHAALAGQPAPYGPFFCLLERALHDHGAVTLAALLQDMAANPELAGLHERLRDMHQFEDEDSPSLQMQTLLHRLRQQAVDDELQALIESGDRSDAAAARTRELLALRAELRRLATAVAQSAANSEATGSSLNAGAV